MTNARVKHCYNVIKTGNEILFSYNQSKLNFKTYLSLLWPSLIASVFLAYFKVQSEPIFQTPVEKLGMGIFYGIIYLFILPLIAVFLMNCLRRKRTLCFQHDGVVVNGTKYSYEDVSNLYIKSPFGDRSDTIRIAAFGVLWGGSNRVEMIGAGAAATVAMGTATVAYGATKLSEASGKLFVKSIQEKSYKICFRFGMQEKALVRRVTYGRALDIIEGLKSLNQISN